MFVTDICPRNRMFTVRSRSDFLLFHIEGGGNAENFTRGRVCAESANRDGRQNTFELDLVSLACLGSYRSTLHRPSPLFRNICSAAITTRWTLEFRFTERERERGERVWRASLDAMVSSILFGPRVDVSDQDHEFLGE